MIYTCSKCSIQIEIITHPKAILYKDEYPKISRKHVFFYGEDTLCWGCDHKIRAGYKIETDNYLMSIGQEIKPKFQKYDKKKHF